MELPFVVMLLMLIDERLMLGFEGLGFGLCECLNGRFDSLGFGNLSIGIEQEVQMTHLLLTFLKELFNLWLMLTTTSIWSSLQGQESFLGSEQTLGQLSREINQAMELLTEALLNRRRGLMLIHSGKPQRKDAPIVSMLFDLSIPQSRGSIAMA